MGPVIEARGLTVRFGPVTAVGGVDLTVGRGEVFGLLGHNGSGKTSLIRAFCGLVGLAGGSALVLGRDIAREAERIRGEIGYMSQKFSLYADLSARENLDFYAGIYGLTAAAARGRRAELIDRIGLGPYLDRRVGRLSGGWKQRLALACALLHRPRLVFLDEPTAGVDPLARRELWDLLTQVAAEGVTIFVTTHYMDEAERCARVGYLSTGRLLALGTPGALKKLPGVMPPGTIRLEVVGPDVPGLLQALRDRPGVRHAAPFGHAVQVLVDVDLMPDDLDREDVRSRVIEPTLEDVFVALAQAQAGQD